MAMAYAGPPPPALSGVPARRAPRRGLSLRRTTRAVRACRCARQRDEARRHHAARERGRQHYEHEVGVRAFKCAQGEETLEGRRQLTLAGGLHDTSACASRHRITASTSPALLARANSNASAFCARTHGRSSSDDRTKAKWVGSTAFAQRKHTRCLSHCERHATHCVTHPWK